MGVGKGVERGVGKVVERCLGKGMERGVVTGTRHKRKRDVNLRVI